MSVIYIPLHRGCSCSAVACKPDEYILGVNRAEELWARYPVRPATYTACGRSLRYQQCRKQDRCAEWAGVAQSISSLLPQPPLLSPSLNAFLMPGFPWKQGHPLLYMGHDTAQNPPGSSSFQLFSSVIVSKVKGLWGLGFHRFGRLCLESYCTRFKTLVQGLHRWLGG